MKGSAFKLGNVATKSALKQQSPMKVAGGVYIPDEKGSFGTQIGKADQELYEAKQKELKEEYEKVKESGSVDMTDWLSGPGRDMDVPLVKTGLEQHPDINTMEELHAKMSSLGTVGEEGWVANNPKDQELLDKLLATSRYERGAHAKEETRIQKELNREADMGAGAIE